MKIIKKYLLFSLAIVSVFGAVSSWASSTIEGVWKHADKPALIEFNLTTGIARVKEHQIHKENAGLTVIRHITQSAQNVWSGEMFNGYLDTYVPVTIQLTGQSLTVFDAGNREVLRLIK